MGRIVYEDSLLPLLLRERLLARRARHVIDRHEAEVRRVLSGRNEAKRHDSDDARNRPERRRQDR
jgi:hypothetical protein